MVRHEVIRRRLDKLAEYLNILERLRGYGRDEFLSDPEHYGSAERFLQLAIEATLDMGSHIVADESLGTVNQSRDVPRLFHSHGYISQEIEQHWIRMIGFRNILVHDYLDVDRGIVHEVLQNDIDDLQALQRVFARFL